MAKSTTPSIELLTLLQQYESLHTSADVELKSSIWNITKARRGRSYQVGGGGTGGFGGVEYSADDVREELRAQAVLECKKEEGDEPNLVGEGGSDDCKGGGETSGGEFVLHLDGMKGVQLRASQAEQLNTISSNKENEGLRRRRGNPVVGEKKEATQIIEEHNTTMNDEEERLQNADPLNLFGVPPPALRVAQAKSRSAVAYYVEVANIANEIIKITNQSK